MFAVHFYEKNNLLLSQLLNQVPSINSEIKIKGRKGKIVSITEIDENKFHIQVELEAVKKQTTLSSIDKKKKDNLLIRYNYFSIKISKKVLLKHTSTSKRVRSKITIWTNPFLLLLCCIFTFYYYTFPILKGCTY